MGLFTIGGGDNNQDREPSIPLKMVFRGMVFLVVLPFYALYKFAKLFSASEKENEQPKPQAPKRDEKSLATREERIEPQHLGKIHVGNGDADGAMTSAQKPATVKVQDREQLEKIREHQEMIKAEAAAERSRARDASPAQRRRRYKMANGKSPFANISRKPA